MSTNSTSRFGKSLASLGFSSYDQYLRSAHWLEFRESYRNSDMPQGCAVCGRLLVSLHHITYRRLGQELLSDVVPLCRGHHHEVHGWLDKNHASVGNTMAAIAHLKGLPAPLRYRKGKKKKQKQKSDTIGPTEKEKRAAKLAKKLANKAANRLANKEQGELANFLNVARAKDPENKVWNGVRKFGNMSLKKLRRVYELFLGDTAV